MYISSLSSRYLYTTLLYILMFSRLVSSSRVLSRVSWCLNDACKAALFREKQRSNRSVFVFGVRNMASGGGDKEQFPPQKQEAQPGKEHQMDPKPECFSQDFSPSNKLRGKVALVTGGDFGIGRAVCHYFAAEGAIVAFTYMKEQEDKDAKETLEILRKAKTSDAEPIQSPTLETEVTIQ